MGRQEGEGGTAAERRETPRAVKTRKPGEDTNINPDHQTPRHDRGRTRPRTDAQGQRFVKTPKRTRRPATPRPRHRPARDTDADRRRQTPGRRGRSRPTGRRDTKAAERPGPTSDGRPSAPGPPRPRPEPRPALTSAPSRRTPGGHGGQPPVPARPRCRGARAGPRVADAEARLGARADAPRAARRRPRRPGARDGRGEPGGGGEPPSGREATEGGDGPEAEVATRPALHASLGPGGLASGKPAQPPLPWPRPVASLPARGLRRQIRRLFRLPPRGPAARTQGRWAEGLGSSPLREAGKNRAAQAALTPRGHALATSHQDCPRDVHEATRPPSFVGLGRRGRSAAPSFPGPRPAPDPEEQAT